MPDSSTGAIFLSYASQDAEAVRRLAVALRAAGVEVWFDQDELRGGDEWDRKIRRQIRECALFVAVISANTQARPEGYFRLEWHLAEQRSLLIPKGRPFIVPLCLDDTTEAQALAPDAFLSVQWSRPTTEAKLAQFVTDIQRLLEPRATIRPIETPVGGTTRVPAIPDFEMLRKIGSGSYGDVWLARSVTGIYRAIKVVWRDRFEEAAPFEREFRGLTEFAAISLGESMHLALLHVGRNDFAGFFYYVMELADDVVRGRQLEPATYEPLTLAVLRARQGRLPPEQCFAFGAELARMLSSLHRRGLVHRDVKPSNIILVNGAPKLADVGLVAPAHGASTYVGTDGYVPPEGPGSPGADVYALGKVLYEILTGLDRQEFPQLPAELDRLPDRRALLALNDVILRACEPRPERRHRDAAALLTDLEKQRAGRRTRRAPAWQLALTSVLVLTFGTIAAIHWRRPAAGATSAAPVSVAPAAMDKSIAVLPFANGSDEKENTYFADGLHQEIISDLAHIAQLRVSSRSSVEPYRSAKKSAAAIASELNVAYILEGNAARTKSRFQVSARLIRARDGEVLWADNLDADIADIFSVESEMAQKIAGKMEAVIAPEEKLRLTAKPTKSLAAYDLYLKARSVNNESFLGAEGMDSQIKLLEEAVELDPDFSRAWVDLADVRLLRVFLGQRGGNEERERCRAAIDQVARLAPGTAELEERLGNYFYEIHKDYGQAMEHFRRAVALEPNVADHQVAMAMILRRQNDWTGSTLLILHAIQLDPGAINNRRYLEQNFTYTRRFAEAAQTLREIGERVPLTRQEQYSLASYSFMTTGSTGEVEAFFASIPESERETAEIRGLREAWASATGDFAELVRLDRMITPEPGGPKDSPLRAMLTAYALAAQGDMAAARTRLADWPEKWRERLERNPNSNGMGWARFARMVALLGRRDEFLYCARRAEAGLSEPSDALWGTEVSVNLASARAWLGDKDEALSDLARLFRTSAPVNVFSIGRGAAFLPLRGDARFTALLADPANRGPLPWNKSAEPGDMDRALALVRRATFSIPAAPVRNR